MVILRIIKYYVLKYNILLLTTVLGASTGLSLYTYSYDLLLSQI